MKLLLCKENKFMIDALENEASEIIKQLHNLRQRVDSWNDIFSALYNSECTLDSDVEKTILFGIRMSTYYQQYVNPLKVATGSIKDLFIEWLSSVRYTSEKPSVGITNSYSSLNRCSAELNK